MRHTKIKAIILHAAIRGEYHKSLTVLTNDHGLIKCTAYGAYKSKSKMVSSTDPFRYVILSLYHNPVKDQYKIEDVEVIKGYEHIRDDMSRIFAATYITEVLQKTFAGGGSDSIFSLVRQSFDLIDTVEEKFIPYILLQFLYRYFNDAGMFYIPDFCSNCEAAIDRKEPVFWTGIEGDFVCHRCNHPADLELSPGAKAYLAHSMEMNIKAACTINTDDATMISAKHFISMLVEQSIGRNPATPWP